jgi:hypothetical protein
MSCLLRTRRGRSGRGARSAARRLRSPGSEPTYLGLGASGPPPRRRVPPARGGTSASARSRPRAARERREGRDGSGGEGRWLLHVRSRELTRHRKDDLHISGETPVRGGGDETEGRIARASREMGPLSSRMRDEGEGHTGMKSFACQEQRMLRALHSRWPYRRSHCRHDLHLLVRVSPGASRCAGGRARGARLSARGRRARGG